MRKRVARSLVVVVAVLAALSTAAAPARHALAVDPTMTTGASAAAIPTQGPTDSPAPTLPPTVGAPGTITPGSTIRGAIGVLIGAIIVIIGWRRRRRANPRTASPPPDRSRR